MAFYLVTDGKLNAFGEADAFVVRAGGRRQAVSLAPLADPKGADVVKLEDGRNVPNGVILSSLVGGPDAAPEPTQDYDSELVESEDAEGSDPFAAYSF
jgi:hypothetical protein